MAFGSLSLSLSLFKWPCYTEEEQTAEKTATDLTGPQRVEDFVGKGFCVGRALFLVPAWKGQEFPSFYVNGE